MHSFNEAGAVLFLEGGGTWQTRQLMLCYIAYFSLAFQTLAIVFTGFQPDFSCLSTNQTSNETSYDNKCNDFNSSDKFSTLYVYDVQHVHESIVSEWDLVCDHAYLAETSQMVYVIGFAVGSAFVTPFSDRFGRKPTYLGFKFLYMLTCFGSALSPDIICFMIFRFSIGAVEAGSWFVIFVQIMELTPSRIRPFAGVVTGTVWPVALCIQVLMAYIMKGVSWRYVQVAMSVPTLTFLFEVCFFKESILWLYANEKGPLASAILSQAVEINGEICDRVAKRVDQNSEEDEFISSSPGLDPPIKDREECATETPKPAKLHITILDICRNRSTAVLTAVICFAWFVNSLLYYAIFFMADVFAGDRYLNFFLNAIVDFPAMGLLFLCIKHFNRKTPLIGLHGACAVALLMGGVLMVTLKNSVKRVIMQILTTLGKFVISATFSLLYIYSTEVFPTNFRVSGLGLASAVGGIGSLLSPFAGILARYIHWGPGICFGGLCLLLTLFLIWAPETRDIRLPQSMVEAKTVIKAKNIAKTGETENPCVEQHIG